MGTLLIAAREEEQAILREVLGSEHRLIFCASLQSASSNLGRDVDAILCSPHFDEGQLFELLELSRLQAGARGTPLYAVVVQSRHFSKHFVEGLKSALLLMGGHGVLDFAAWRHGEGEQHARQSLQRAVAYIVDGVQTSPTPVAPDWQLQAA